MMQVWTPNLYLGSNVLNSTLATPNAPSQNSNESKEDISDDFEATTLTANYESVESNGNKFQSEDIEEIEGNELEES